MLETKRCIIRKFNNKDIDDLYLILSNPKVMKYVEEPFTREKTEKFLLENALGAEPGIYAIEAKDTKKLLGHLIFKLYDKNRYELGWILDKKYWGRGIASELTKKLIAYSRTKDIHSLIIECTPDHLASIQIAENNDFKLMEENNLLLFELVL